MLKTLKSNILVVLWPVIGGCFFLGLAVVFPVVKNYYQEVAFGATVAGAVRYFWFNERAKSRKYAGRKGETKIIAIRVSKPVAEAVVTTFGREADHFLDCEKRYGPLLSGPEIMETAQWAIDLINTYQDCHIKMVVHGPGSIFGYIMGMTGFKAFDIVMCEYDVIEKAIVERAEIMPSRQ